MSDNDSGLLPLIAKLLPVYAIYVFVSGWAFWDYYFRYFGTDPRWLDIGFNDTLMKGFTVLFSDEKHISASFLEGAGLLWLVYIALFLITLIVLQTIQSQVRSRLLIASLLAILLFFVYCISRSAGENRARQDSGDSTRLPTIVFTIGNSSYHGKLLALRNGTYFIH